MNNNLKVLSQRILSAYGEAPKQTNPFEEIATKCNESFQKGLVTESEFNSAIDYFEDLMKGMGHKYFKREGTAGNYKYYYTEAEYKKAKGGEQEPKKETGKVEFKRVEDVNLKDVGMGKLKGFIATKGNKALHLYENDGTIAKQPYSPAGGTSVLKEIIKDTEEGKTYAWVDIEESKKEVEPNFSLGQKVYYKPKLSGFDNSKPLVVDNVKFKEGDELTKEGFYYQFKNSNLSAHQDDLKQDSIQKSEQPSSYDILKSDITYAFDNYENPLEITKKGSLIKSMAEVKLPLLQEDLMRVKMLCEAIKLKLQEQGVVVDEEKEFLNEVESESDMIKDDLRKYFHLKWKQKDIQSDIDTLQIVIEGIDENKSYKLTVRQIKSLK